MFAFAKSAFQDISGGVRLRRVWLALAHEDIDDQHRRTALGPIWLLVNYLIYIGTFVVVFGSSSPIPNFTAYVSIGMLIFLFVQEIMTLSVTLFQREAAFIAGTTLPLTVYVLRLLMQSTIRTGYATLGCFAILLIVGTPITFAWLWSLLGIAIVLLLMPAIVVIFATAGAFFPDLQFIIANIVRISMFLTPIFWVVAGGVRGSLYNFNPLTHLIEIVRMPIVSGTVPIYSLTVSLGLLVVCWAAAIVLLGMFRRRIVFLL